MKAKLALLGTSSAGKTSCAFALNGSGAGDMDSGKLGVFRCPTSGDMIEWIIHCPVNVIAVSVHVSDPGKGILGIRDLKHSGSDSRLSRIHFVYLNVSKVELEARIRTRKPSVSSLEMAEALRSYEQNDRLFSEVADIEVDTTGLTRDEVKERIRMIKKSMASER